MQFINAFKKFVACFVIAGLVAIPMIGCAGRQTATSSADKEIQAKLDPVEANKQYMAGVNTKANELSSELQDFSDYVSKSDVVNMKLSVDKACKVLDDIKAIDAPDQMKDIHSKYSDAVDSLKSSLSKYADVFASYAGDSSSKIIDNNAEQALKDVRDAYSTAVEKFKSADDDAKSNESLFNKNTNNNARK